MGRAGHREAGVLSLPRSWKSGPQGSVLGVQTGSQTRRQTKWAAGGPWGLLAQDPGNIKCGATQARGPMDRKGSPEFAAESHPQRQVHRGLPPTRAPGLPWHPSILERLMLPLAPAGQGSIRHSGRVRGARVGVIGR